jgi:hypothetical protein
LPDRAKGVRGCLLVSKVKVEALESALEQFAVADAGFSDNDPDKGGSLSLGTCARMEVRQPRSRPSAKSAPPTAERHV